MQGLYEYDAVTRLRDSQLGDERVKDVKNYIKKGKLWEAFEMKGRPVLLIDEIDKADIEFPNDLLLELDRMEFFVYETGETIKAAQRPIILITSNNEKELPDAFLRRCFFHYIKFPERDTMQKIIDVHYPNIKQKLVSEALNVFYQIRDVPGLKKKPSTVGTARLAEAAAERRHSARGAEGKGSDQAHPAAARRAAQERAGRAPVRAAGVPGAERTEKLVRVRKLALAVIGCLALSPAAAQTTNIDAFKDGADEAKVHSASGFVCPLFIGHFERDAYGERDADAGLGLLRLLRARRRLRHDHADAAEGGLRSQDGAGSRSSPSRKASAARSSAKARCKIGGGTTPISVYTRTYETAALETLHYRIMFSGRHDRQLGGGGDRRIRHAPRRREAAAIS